MAFDVVDIGPDKVADLLDLHEGHFADLKSSEIAPAKLAKTFSAFANTGGGDVYIGIEEVVTTDGKERIWKGFADQEAANPIFQVMETLGPLANNYSAEFFRSAKDPGLVLHINIFKTQEIISATDGKTYVRRNAQSLPLAGADAIDRLKYDKGVRSFEDEVLNVDATEITNSVTVLEFLIDAIPTGEPEEWLSKQRVTIGNRPTVAGDPAIL
ncbi:ATP-binding protein [Rhizobium sp. YTUHZ044]|uniref:AlbA family DNA-binding domain-containing protein n=1 Tax=Rhizobium sp. YTUHZ044 TaxID=2962678 RepID=UPI003DAA049A